MAAGFSKPYLFATAGTDADAVEDWPPSACRARVLPSLSLSLSLPLLELRLRDRERRRRFSFFSFFSFLLFFSFFSFFFRAAASWSCLMSSTFC